MSGGMSSHLNPYAAAYAQNAMAWNTYSMQTFQGLQRAGVTYGRNTLFYSRGYRGLGLHTVGTLYNILGATEGWGYIR